MACIGAFHGIIIAILVVAASTVSCDDTIPIPADPAQVSSWFQANVKPYASRKDNLDPALEAAEATRKIIRVRKDGTGNFKTVTDAIESIPSGNKQRVFVYIGPGVYTEKITVDRTKPFVTFYGNPNAMPTLAFDGTAEQYGTVYSASLTVESDYFSAANIIIQNTAPKPDGRPGAQAVAFKISGDKAAFYNCRILGFQDTLCDDKGQHFFKDCFIQGTVDFIFGSGKSLYLRTQLNVIEDSMMVITAQARQFSSENSGYSFVHCSVTGKETGAYLGRAWMDMPRVVFSYSILGSIVNPLGWSNNFRPQRNRTIFFAEYKNSGPGSNLNRRVSFTKQLNFAEAKPFISLAFIQGSQWLLPPPVL